MVLPKQHNSYGNPIPTLDEYIENNLNALFEVGVLRNWAEVDFDSFWKSPECWKAWESYVHRGLNAPVGMGLYALQLKPFLDMLMEINGENTNPSVNEIARRDQILSEYFLALDSQDLQLDADKTYQQTGTEILETTILPFVGISNGQQGKH